ncbi:CDP-glycerol glycerophosphotransferase family protein [Buttiauxella gaviniae]|uniref:CDP-glycerol glycerophosphotransferase family protein n=1 Tax=Buttiauxella gaviniae TaxID=82990 RepID=UPI003C762001
METSFHYEVYQNIIIELLDNHISCQLIINDLIEVDFVNNMTSFLNEVDEPRLSCILLSTVLHSSKTFSCLVSPYYLPYAEKISKIHIRTVYGLAKNEWNHAQWNEKYDCVLCYSHYTKDSLQDLTDAQIVGNPRFDDWHKKNFPVNMPGNFKLDPSKPTLLYAPTYGELSSLPHWAEKISRLSKEYNIITKLHHGTLYRSSEKNSLKLAKRFLKNITPSKISIFSILKNVDYVISDNSGFIFDAINADKKIILLNWPGMNKLLVNNKSLSTTESAEQTVREFLPVANDMEDMRNYLADGYEWDKHKKHTHHIKYNYCDAFNDGSAGFRAAKVIMSKINESN